MSSDIVKMSVVDSRIVQSRPAYAVDQGALSLTNAPFNAISATSSQHTYNIYYPSENVFSDRRPLWTSTVNMQVPVTIPSVLTPGSTVIAPGVDFSLASMPLNRLCATIQATINDTTAVINTQDVLEATLRLTDKGDNRLCRTAPTMLDTYASYNDAYGSQANPLAGYESSTAQDRVPNGAFPGLVFTDTAGVALATTSTYGSTAAGSTPAFTGAAYARVNGVPVIPQQWLVGSAYVVGALIQDLGIAYLCNANVTGGNNPATNASWTAVANGSYAGGTVNVYFKWTSSEPIIISPFVFSDENEWSTGLFGVNNVQLLMNLVPSPSRVIRSTTRNGRTLGTAIYNTTAGAFSGARVDVQFLTPSLSVPLPPKSVVPYMEFPRYISQAVSCAALSDTQLSSQTITLPQIPDLLVIFAKPTATYGSTDADWILPLSSIQTGGTVRNPLSVNFDNFSGLLSSHTSEELFAMCRKNGLEMDWATWCGIARAGASAQQAGARVQTAGGLLVLKPSQDITLQSGQAPSLVGNFTLQFNLSVYNPRAAAVDVQLFVITVNSGFFETIRGSSRIIKGVLSEQDIIDAPRAGVVARNELNRMVGGLSLKSLGNVLSTARNVYEATKPLQGILKQGLDVASNVAGALGSGTGGGAGGGRTGGRKKQLESRLM